MSTKRSVATALIDRASILCSEENLPTEEARIQENLKKWLPQKVYQLNNSKTTTTLRGKRS